MTILKRIKDYIDRKGHPHYHFEKIDNSDEPTEYDLRGEDREAIEMSLGIGALTKEDLKRLEGKV